MTAQTQPPDIHLMAILGACIAATVFVIGWGLIGVGVWILEDEPLSAELLFDTISFLLVAFAIGVVIALVTAFPLGWLYGRLILWLLPPSMSAAVLTGALTGATLIVVIYALDNGGFSEMWQPAALFAALGAMSGAISFHLIMRRGRHGILN